MRLASDSNPILLSYSTNVHPGEGLADLERIIATDVRAVRDALAYTGPFGLELRFSGRMAADLEDASARERLQTLLRDEEAFLFSINGFPIQDFHAPVVKDEVYRPDWTTPERFEITRSLCHLLADFLPEGMTGSVSTSPGGFKPWGMPADFLAHVAHAMTRLILDLESLESRTGARVVLAIEPEPFCTIETAQEMIDFYTRLMPEAVRKAGRATAVESLLSRHLGVTLDACHAAVEFESATILKALTDAGVPVTKLHLSAAACVSSPTRESLRALADLDEPRYLHQTFGIGHDGTVCLAQPDLAPFLATAEEDPTRFAEIRTHFHLPLYEQEYGALRTSSSLTEALLQDALALPEIPHLVVETYTWPLVASSSTAITEGIAKELSWAQERILAQVEGRV